VKPFFTNAPSPHQQLIRTETRLVQEPDVQRFRRQLRAHLLDEGCNLPLTIAIPRFYETMATELLACAALAVQQQFTDTFDPSNFGSHEDFRRAMLFWEAHLPEAGPQIARAVIKSIDTLKAVWQLDDELFQESVSRFDQRVQTLIAPLFQHQPPMTPAWIRRRLYLALTTSLLRHLTPGQPFYDRFGTVPEVLNAMQDDHTVFCRVMAWFRDQIPYFHYLASRTFWRTLETLYLE
jgi:hypothetical protein